MRKPIIFILTLFTSLLFLSEVAIADETRVIDKLKSFGHWGAGIGIQNGIGPNGLPLAMKYAFVGTDINHPQAGPMYIEILLPPNGSASLSIITPNLSGQYFAPIGAIDATLVAGNHSARLLGQAMSQVNFIYYFMPNFPSDFFKWVSNSPVFSIEFPLGSLPIFTDGLNQASAYAMKLRKGL